MTLARSHRLRLNGNSILMILLIASIFMFDSCKHTKVVQEDKPVEITPIVKEPVDKAPVPHTVDENPTKDQPEADTTSEDPWRDPIDIKDVKKITDIALILPFKSNQIPEHIISYKNLEMEKAAQMASEFYLGSKIALEQFRGNNSELAVNVYDSENNPLSVDKIFEDPDFKKNDLIVGPIYNATLRRAAQYARTMEIPIISPLSSSKNITSKNPFYYSANASTEIHMAKILDYITAQKYFDHLDIDNYNHINSIDALENELTIYVLHMGSELEIKTLNKIKALKIKKEKELEKAILLNEIEISKADQEIDLSSVLDSNKNSIVIVPSFSEDDVLFALNQLVRIKKVFPLTVFGMPTWKNLKSINYDYLEWLDVYITSSSFNRESHDFRTFNEIYRHRYNLAPTKYAYQGYDLFKYLLQFTNKEISENEWPLYNQHSTSGIYTQFNFQPKLDYEDKINYFENNFVTLLRFENYDFLEVEN